MRGKKKTHEREPLRCYDGVEGVAERVRQREEGEFALGWEGWKECEGEGEGRSREGRETLGEATHEVSGCV